MYYPTWEFVGLRVVVFISKVISLGLWEVYSAQAVQSSPDFLRITSVKHNSDKKNSIRGSPLLNV